MSNTKADEVIQSILCAMKEIQKYERRGDYTSTLRGTDGELWELVELLETLETQEEE